MNNEELTKRLVEIQTEIQQASAKGDYAAVMRLSTEIGKLQQQAIAQSTQAMGALKTAQANAKTVSQAAAMQITTAQPSAATAYSADTVKGNPVFKPLPGGLRQIDDNHVEFGSYPQAKDGGIQKIVWCVLDKQNGGLLLVSKHVLDCKKWHDTQNTKFPKTGRKEDIAAAITAWEQCDLRKWLNGYFYNHAFNSQEMTQIIERLNTGNGAYIHRDYKPVKGKDVNLGRINDDTFETYEERGCRDTRDKVFLLNVREALDYFKRETYTIDNTVWLANLDRDATATEYIKARTQTLNPFNGETWSSDKKNRKKIKVAENHIGSVSWWLRNIGCNDAALNNAAFHTSQTATVAMGAIFTGGTLYFALGLGVRPAILIKT